MISRRQVLTAAGATALAGTGLVKPDFIAAHAAAPQLPTALPEGLRETATLESLPGKKPLIKLSYRPPNYESPIEYFRTPITPNDEFFVRYHLSDIPEIDAKTWKLSVGGDGANTAVTLTLDELKAMPAFEVVAVNQCSGNRRGLFQPHVPGVEWGYGAMGCARWKGARLKDILDKAGLKKEAIEISFDGADGPALDKTPDFIKSLPDLEGDRGHDLDRLRDERRTAAASQRLSGAPRRARLDRHLLDEAPDHDQRADEAARHVLDGVGLSRAAWQVSAGRALHLAGDRGKHADHRDGGELADHLAR